MFWFMNYIIHIFIVLLIFLNKLNNQIIILSLFDMKKRSFFSPLNLFKNIIFLILKCNFLYI